MSEQRTPNPTPEASTLHRSVDRRTFLNKAGLGVAGVAAGSALLAACSTTTVEDEAATGDSTDGDSSTDSGTEEVTTIQGDGPEIEWNMATSWPTALVTLYGAAELFANEVSRLTGGRFKINARPAGEIVGGTEVLPAVRDGGVEVGHTAASYYYTGLSPIQQFGTAVPFGLTQLQHNAWLYEGGGLDLLNEFYAEEHGLITFPAGGTGCQMGGWFSREIETVADLQWLKMRIPGLAGTGVPLLGETGVVVRFSCCS